MVEIVAVNMSEHLAMEADGTLMRLDTFLDEDGEVCGAEAAVSAIAMGSDGKWHAIDFRDFERTAPN